MEKSMVELICDMNMQEIKNVDREKKCEGCGMWPCYAMEDEVCARYEENWF